MKKIYCQPEWEMVTFEEDIVTASGVITGGGGDTYNESEPTDVWEW
ncbi:MAG: hypothetical protein IJX87_00140 [Clostridia bacterium]|nr:hypothetical protein [Clostridia bacterium]